MKKIEFQRVKHFVFGKGALIRNFKETRKVKSRESFDFLRPFTILSRNRIICIDQLTRSFASFLLSHIGLLSLVVGYCIMGAFIFEELEKVGSGI